MRKKGKKNVYMTEYCPTQFRVMKLGDKTVEAYISDTKHEY